MIVESQRFVGRAVFKGLVKMKSWSVTLRPNIQIVRLAEHEVIIFTCHQISAHLWLDRKDEAVLATYVLGSG